MSIVAPFRQQPPGIRIAALTNELNNNAGSVWPLLYCDFEAAPRQAFPVIEDRFQIERFRYTIRSRDGMWLRCDVFVLEESWAVEFINSS